MEAAKHTAEALRLADELSMPHVDDFYLVCEAAALELQSLHSENALLKEAIENERAYVPFAKHVALRELNDELLAALQEVFVIGDRLVDDVYGHEFVEKARAAIAKATQPPTGEQT